MQIICNITGSERKRLADVLGAHLLMEPIYKKAPTFAYVVSDYTIDKNGTIICPESASVEDVAKIVAKLEDEGFTTEIEGIEPVEDDSSEENPIEEAPAEIPAEMPDVAPEAEPEGMPEDEATEADVGAETPDAAAPEEETATDADQPEEDVADEDESADTDDTKLTVSIPREKLADDALDRLRTTVSNKEELFKRALLADTLPIDVTEDKVSFPWFTLTGIDGEATAYTQFITALCQMATEQKRVLDKPYDGDNDRFTMRIFMVCLGMKGPEFALARKLMMKHLTGNSGWRYEDSASRPDRSNPHRSTVQHLRKAYPKDSRIELIPMDGVTSDGVQVGAHGKLLDVDESGTVFIALDDGSAFGIAFSAEQVEENTDDNDSAAFDLPEGVDSEIPFETDSVEESEAPAEDSSDDSSDDVVVEDESYAPVSDEDEPDAEEDDEE